MGCGSERVNVNKPVGTAGESSGDGGGSGSESLAPRSPCDASNAFPIWGKRYDVERDCIDTDKPVEGVACTLQPQEGDDPYYSDGFACLENKDTHEQLWVFAFNRVGFDEALWQRCPNAPLVAPKGCYAAGCASAPRSSCPLEQTKEMFGCGPTNEFDESCCGRPVCKTDGDCGANEQCATFQTLGQWYCWDNPGNTCDCGGPLYGPPVLRCAAR